jgi:asparagine synthase (glutamine-hydrolysing)
MCGIAGVFGNKDFTTKTLDQMLSVIKHRGPDDQGELFEGAFSFGMRRLSIIDLGGGHQPIWNEDKTVVIVFNGEIYNHLELHQELVAKGHIFRTQSDTEAIVHLYEECARQDILSGLSGVTANASTNTDSGVHTMLNKLRGMFGFAIYDFTAKKMLIARDHFGIKPIYYRTAGLETASTIAAFGSEIKSLLKDDRYKPEVNHDAIHNYLSFQFNPLSETCFKHIHTLAPGSYMIADPVSGAFDIGTYWSYTFASEEQTRTDEKTLAEDIFRVMQDSVSHHLISDVPVGAFLSGGIDSAITVTLVQKERERLGLAPVKTFTIGFEEVSEHETAREVSDSLKTDHHEIKISFDEYFKELPQIAWHFDEPVADPSAVALYFLAREARKHVKVVLSGEGADELFGGYNIYREPFDLKHIAGLPKLIQTIFIRPLLAMPFNFFGKNYLKRALTAFDDRYIGNAYIFKPAEAISLWNKDVRNNYLNNGKLTVREHLYPGKELKKQIPDFDLLPESRRMQLVDIHYWLRGDILAKADKMTMAHSLELRVPYLDVEVAKVSATIADELKYKAGKTKYILRKAFEHILPQTTVDRRKLGFPTPIKHWLKKQPDEVKRIIKNNTYVKEHFDVVYIDNLFSEHLAGKRDHARKIYILLMLSLWYNQYII